MSDYAHSISDEITILGPMGIWPFKYRVTVRDIGDYDSAGEWRVSVEKARRGHWFPVGRLGTGEKVTLYQEGQDRAGTIPDRTEPSESEREQQLAAHRAFWGCDCGTESDG